MTILAANRRSQPSPLSFILLGMFLLGVFPYLWFNIYAEYRGMGETPQQIDVATFPAPAPNRGRWVLIPQLTVECDNRAVEAGRSPHTLFVAHAPGSARTLIIDAGTGRPTCDELPRMSVRGVLRPLTQRRRAYLEGRGLRVDAASDALVLTWGETPKSSRVLLYLLPIVGLVGAWLLQTGLRRLVRLNVHVTVHRNEA